MESAYSNTETAQTLAPPPPPPGWPHGIIELDMPRTNALRCRIVLTWEPGYNPDDSLIIEVSRTVNFAVIDKTITLIGAVDYNEQAPEAITDITGLLAGTTYFFRAKVQFA